MESDRSAPGGNASGYGGPGGAGVPDDALAEDSWSEPERGRRTGAFEDGGYGDEREPHEHGAVVSFLEDQLRARPLPTLLAAVAAGWLVGKILR